jgi:arylsulfatase A-like enzyme
MVPSKAHRKPNIMVLIMDTVRADHCSTWGYRRATTPCLDRLAQTSTVYTQAISPSSWTLPAHVSLFTGLFPSEHGVLTGQDRLEENIPLLAEILQAAGYRTAGFTNNPWASSLYGLDRGFEWFVEMFRGERGSEKGLLRKNLDRAQRLMFLKDGGAGQTNVRVMEWIKRWNVEGTGAPFFIFVNYMDAHQVYAPKRPFHRGFSGRLRSYPETLRNRNIARDKARVYAGIRRLSADDYVAMVNMYDRAIRYLDFRIGELIGFLEKRRLLDETLLIVTSDHGDNFGEHRLAGVELIGHLFCLYDSLLRVPLLARWPEVFEKGRGRTDLVQLTDIFRALLSLLSLDGAGPQEWWAGNLLSEDKRKFAFAEYVTPSVQLEAFRQKLPEHAFEQFDVDLKAIRTLSHKLIRFQDGQEEFYCLQDDPAEMLDLSVRGGGVHTRLADALDRWIAALPVQPESAAPYDVLEDEMIRRRLADLGYL